MCADGGRFRRVRGSPRAYAASGGALPLHPAPTRRAAGRCPCTPRLRGEWRGSAPAPRACAAGGRALPCTRWGFRPRPPEMLAHLCLACGRDGGLAYGLRTVACAVLFMHIGWKMPLFGLLPIYFIEN
ncbi:hypothetical protein D7X33_20820 [Butyricicoccus sp. 1XD8-22]|nr:hypothetical protein D7X33_20820 [Butyricicoccus sp. 1XD8-22]